MKKFKSILALILALCLVVSLCACGTTSSGSASNGNTTDDASAEADVSAENEGADAEALYTPGTYTASADGKNGPVTVSVVFSENAIESVEVIEHQETEGVADGAIENIPGKIVENQSLDIDAVSGATLTSTAILNAVADCVAQAGGDVDALKAAEVDSSVDDALQNCTTDVLVIGSGAAGLSAAVSAAETGASVILVEKQDTIGGTTILSAGSFAAVDIGDQEMSENDVMAVEALLAEEGGDEKAEELRATVQAQWDEYLASGSTAYFDTYEYYALQLLSGGSYEGDVDLILNMTQNATDTLHWTEQYGVEWGPVRGRTHDTINVTATDIVDNMSASFIELGGEIYCSSRATALLSENGTVTGAIVTNANGEDVTVTVNKGVILATGGFSANTEMRSTYSTIVEIPDYVPAYGSAGSTGDGIQMAEAVGANLVQMEYITFQNDVKVSGGQIARNPDNSIYVNLNGERFCAEGDKSPETILAMLAQDQGLYYMVSDFAEAEAQGYTLEDLAELTEQGKIFYGETLEELAAAIGVPAENLAASVDEYNAAVDAGQPDEFGRTKWGNKIENGPYVAVLYSVAVHSTLGGVQINTDAQVIDTDGNPIQGLYAAGEVTGGIHGASRTGGMTIADAMTYGHIAGAKAAAN